MVYAMQLCVHVKTADIPFKLTHSTHLQMLFHRKELNTTKEDWFLSNLAFMLPSSENLSKMLEEDLGSSLLFSIFAN